ncbi:MAG: zinc ribbon domain-containing protein [Promethearchaeota archaeon]
MGFGRGGGAGRRGRYRWMYNMTGLPGWIRFGFSPGWQDRNPQGLPPTAQWLQQSGLMQQYLEWLQNQGVQSEFYGDPTQQPPVPPTSQPPQLKEQEKAFLEQQSKILQAQLEALKKSLNKMKYCSHCGQELEKDDIFCFNCGAKQDMGKKVGLFRRKDKKNI